MVQNDTAQQQPNSSPTCANTARCVLGESTQHSCASVDSGTAAWLCDCAAVWHQRAIHCQHVRRVSAVAQSHNSIYLIRCTFRLPFMY